MAKRYRHTEKHKIPLSYWAAQFETERADQLADAPVPLRHGSERYTYTVMADCGMGEFLWGKESTDHSCRLGSNIYSLMDERDYPVDIPVDLFLDMCAWARKYMQAMPYDWSQPWELDWDAFNAEGISLARRLKQELGDTADVQYVRAWDDPDRERGEVMVIAAPGTEPKK